jgi:DNA replication protein DnaC
MTDVTEILKKLGFRAHTDQLGALLIHATKNRLSPTQTMEQLVALERREREARNLAARTRVATLGSVMPLDRFDWNHPRQIDRPAYEELLSLDFVRKKRNVLFRGQSGVGKTTLAQNLGLRALEGGMTVCFTTVGAALADLLKRESLPAVERRLRKYTSVDLLICDELGYLPFDSRSADLLFNIVSRRHEKASTIITTNLPFKEWGTVFPGAACVVALVDRLTQHCHVIDIDADSGRQIPPPSSPPPARPKAKVKIKSKEPATASRPAA